MNDRAISILEQYEMTAIRTIKVRGAIVFETENGTYILKEYEGPSGKLAFLHELLCEIHAETGIFVDYPIPDKEGNFLATGKEGIRYIVKCYQSGVECNPLEEQDLKRAVKNMALLHKALKYHGETLPKEYEIYHLSDEVERLQREMVRIRKFLIARRQKTYFEQELLQAYPYFEEQSLRIGEEIRNRNFSAFYDKIKIEGQFVHGDYQYHNCLFSEDKDIIVNFEKCRMDTCVKDLAQFIRKTLEKSEWNPVLGDTLIQAYNQVSVLSEDEMKQLYFRLSYPEKFRKIVNYYMNSNKAFISGQQYEKLEKLKALESKKAECIKALF